MLRRARVWIAVASLSVALPASILLRQRLETHALPVLGPVPSFRLVDQRARAFSSDELRGRVWVADFIFVDCVEACPLLTSKLANLGRAIADEERRRGKSLGVRLVSFSVNPERDTPERLAAYAAKWRADEARWTFLTGPAEELERVVVQGFRVGMQKVERKGVPDIIHGNWFVLVDRQGNIRGMYGTSTAEELATVTADVLRLASD